MDQLSNNAGIEPVHGGRVFEAARRWQMPPEAVLDFSANINPLGPPPGVLSAVAKANSGATIQSYPETVSFVDAVARRHQLLPEHIVVGSGAAGLLFAAIRALAPRKVAILEPAFGEYRQACLASSAEVIGFELKEDDAFLPDFPKLQQTIESRSFDLLVLNNPHNPSGAMYSREEALKLIEKACARNVAIIIDEAFIDYAPGASVLSVASMADQTIVVRSLTKFYAIPGLRIGYAVCNDQLAQKIRNQIDAWPVSTVALEAGKAAVSELDFEVRSRQTNDQARAEFSAALSKIGLKVFPSAANFLLAKLPHRSGRALELWLEPARILIRRCDCFSGLSDQYIRLAVRSHEDNLRLVGLIEEWLQSASSN